MPIRAALLLLCLGLVGCPSERPAAAEVPTATDGGRPGEPTQVAAAARRLPPPEQDEAPRPTDGILRIRAGDLAVGSRPGLAGRDPRREAALVPVPMGAFDIDAAPVEQTGLRRTARSQGEARSACSQRGRRLCTELEWEQGCKRGADAFVWSGPEWTDSAGGPSFGDAPTVVVRGGDLDPGARSCAVRRALTADASPRGVGFRCCGGEPAPGSYPAPTRGRAFRRLDVDQERVRSVLAEIPELARYAADFRLFLAGDAERALRRCSGTRADLHGWDLVDGVLEWAPGWGPANWVFAGRSGDDAMVVILHRVGSDFVHGSSFVNTGDPAPIAITYTPPSRDTLRFDASVGCVAEGGVIAAEADGRVMTYHRRVGW